MTTAHDLHCCVDSVEVVLATAYRVNVAKALDPTRKDDFVTIVRRLTDAIRVVAEPERARALRTALNVLDVDWKTMTPEARSVVVEAARQAIGASTERIMPVITEQFRIVGGRTMRDARAGAVRRFGLQIQTSLTQRDLDAEAHVRNVGAFFVRDEFGVRRDEFAVQARDVVARGLEQGLGRDAIARELQTTLGGSLARTRAYWQVVANQFVNMSRTSSLLNAYSDAGIARYKFEAVLDEATTEVCRFYHDQEFSTAEGQAAMQRTIAAAATDPESVYNTNPWLRVGRDAEGNREIYINRGEERISVARIETSGVGVADAIGTFSNAMTPSALASNGVPWPPLHGNCRSTIIPI